MAFHFEQHCQSFEEFDQSIANFDGRTIPTSLQTRNYELTVGVIGEVTIQHAREGGANFYQSVMDSDVVTIGVGLPGSEQIWAMGQHLNQKVMAIARPGEEAFTRCTGDGNYLLITVPVDRFSTLVGEIDPSQHKRLLEGTNRLDTFEENWNALTETFIKSLNLLSHQEPISDSNQLAMEQELLHQLITSAVYSAKEESSCGRPRISRSRAHLRTKEFCNETQPDRWAVSRLAKHVGIPERSLRNIFLDLYGVSPKRFLTNHRLVKVREQLRHGNPDKTIAEVVSKLGFWQWGQLSRDYKNLFGETPSQTKRR